MLTYEYINKKLKKMITQLLLEIFFNNCVTPGDYMKYRNSSDLVSLAVIANKSNSTTEKELAIQKRLSRSWILVVGPILVHQTCLIRIHRGTMLIGCWHYDIMSSLRQSAEITWPQIKARIKRLWKIHLHSVEVVPCDPPTNLKCASNARKNEETDHFMVVLDILRKQNKSWVDHKVRMQ